MSLETIRRGLYLPAREAPATSEKTRKYLRGDEFLLKNPFKKPKKSKTKKGGGSPSRRKSMGKKNKSPKGRSKSPKKKRTDSASDDMVF